MNRGEIRTAIQAHGYGTDTATAQNEAINQVDRELHGRRRWPWQEATDSSGTVSTGASEISAMPADFLAVDSVRAERGTQYYDLDYVEPPELRRLLHVDRDNGIPQYWTYWKGKVVVYPRADASYTLTLDYIKNTSLLDDDADVPMPPKEYHDIYVWGAIQLLAARERDWQQHVYAREQYGARIQQMEDAVGLRQRQTSDRVVNSRDRYVRRSRWW